ncbi:MAG: TIGR00296 family protein [Nitrososphaerales archaeon]
MHLSEQDGAELVKLAREAIENYLIKNIRITVQESIAKKYNEKAGVFVTLNSIRNKSEELRGCIGFPMPEKILYEAVINASIASATDDPRFKPVEKEELDSITLEISVLTKPELIIVKDPREYKERIKVGRDGLIVYWRYGSGLLLPQVPIEYGWDEERFLCETCIKAGTMPDCWFYEDTKIYKFEAMVFKEVEARGNVIRVPIDVIK